MKTSKEALIENLIVENYEKYYRLAFSYVHNEADALDIVQEGAYKAIFKCDSLKEESFAGTWIYRVMLNEIFLFCRKKQTYAAENFDALNAVEEDFAFQKEKDLLLQEAFENLPPKEKAVIELRYFEDMKLEEISAVLDENLSTVKSRLYRALEKMKLSMTE